MHILHCCLARPLWLEIDKDVSRAVADDGISEVRGACGELLLSLGGLDVAEGIEGRAVYPAVRGGESRAMRDPDCGIHIVSQGE